MLELIETADQFLEEADRIPLDDNSLSAYMARNFAESIRSGESPDKAIAWRNCIVRQNRYAGQIVDFTIDNPPIFDELRIGVCPICNRQGKIYDDPKYPSQAEHLILVHTGMAYTVIDGCRWGDWRQFSPGGNSAQRSEIPSHERNYGLGINITRKVDTQTGWIYEETES